MKIAAIYPCDVKDFIGVDLFNEQPLGIAYVAQAAIDAGHSVDLFYCRPSLDSLLDYDVLAFSSLTKDIPFTIDLSVRVKEKNSDIITVVGGSHISGDKSLVLNDSIDFGVIGEGEETFVELLSSLEKPSSVKGVVYEKKSKVVFTGSKQRLNPTDLRPLRVDACYGISNPALFYPPASVRGRLFPTLASRGCTMGCEFCDSELVWGKEVIYRSINDILDELNGLHIGARDVIIFEDDNFLSDPLIVTALLENLVDRDYNLLSCGDIRKATPELLYLMKKAGWNSIFWGAESINPFVLARDKVGSSPKKVYQVLSNAEQLGIMNMGMIMIGFDYESEQDILAYRRELTNYPVHQLRLAIVTPFPGTKMYKRLKKQGHSFDPDFSHWDTSHLVYDHPTITPERMREIRHEIVRNFYKSKQWDKRMYNMAKQFPKLKQSIDEFRDYIKMRVQN